MTHLSSRQDLHLFTYKCKNKSKVIYHVRKLNNLTKNTFFKIEQEIKIHRVIIYYTAFSQQNNSFI